MNEIGSTLEQLDTPFLWTDLDVLERNIVAVAAHFARAGVAWRPHTKGVKIPAIAHKMIAAGAVGITCAKLGEAEVMVAAGIRDVLIANQIVGPHKYTRLAALQHHGDVKIAVDSPVTLPALGEAARKSGVTIGVLVEVDVGMGRAGVQPGASVVELAQRVDEQDGLRFAGLMAWEGHTLTIDDPDEKQRAIERAIELLTDSADACRSAGLPVSLVSCGGSGTMRVTPFLPGVTEIQAGGAIFGDALYQDWGVITEPALFVRAVVTSRPAPDRIIVDAGFKTLPGWIRPAEPVGVADVAKFVTSAEHGILTLSRPNHRIQVGHKLDFLVGYGDATVFLHDRLYGMRSGRVEVIWEIAARGRLR